MTKFIIHIGPAKTASSYLQQCLFDNAPRPEAGGVHLACRWNDTAEKPSHSGLLERLNTERRGELQPVFDSWRRSRLDQVVISSEGLASMSLEPVKVLMLRELIGEAPVKIVFYARRWSELLSSEWQEYVKQGSTLHFLEVLAHNLRNAATSRIVNIDTCLSVYAGIFGRDSISIVSYDEVVESGLDIFDHFAASCLVRPDIRSIRHGPVNRSLSPAQAELVRLFNVLKDETGVHGQKLLPFFQRQRVPPPLETVLRKLEHFVGSIELSDGDPLIRAIQAHNREQYAECVVSPIPSDSFCRSKTIQASFIKPDYGLLVGLPVLVRKLWPELLAYAE